MDRDTPPRLRLLAACFVALAAMASYQAASVGPPVLGLAVSADPGSAETARPRTGGPTEAAW